MPTKAEIANEVYKILTTYDPSYVVQHPKQREISHQQLDSIKITASEVDSIFNPQPLEFNPRKEKCVRFTLLFSVIIANVYGIEEIFKVDETVIIQHLSEKLKATSGCLSFLAGFSSLKIFQLVKNGLTNESVQDCECDFANAMITLYHPSPPAIEGRLSSEVSDFVKVPKTYTAWDHCDIYMASDEFTNLELRDEIEKQLGCQIDVISFRNIVVFLYFQDSSRYDRNFFEFLIERQPDARRILKSTERFFMQACGTYNDHEVDMPELLIHIPRKDKLQQ